MLADPVSKKLSFIGLDTSTAMDDLTITPVPGTYSITWRDTRRTRT